MEKYLANFKSNWVNLIIINATYTLFKDVRAMPMACSFFCYICDP